MSIVKQLKKLNKTALVGLINDLYGVYDDVDEIIDRQISVSDDSDGSLNSTIQRQLKQIKDEQTFVDYYSSGGFSSRLESILIDIDTLLREQNPKQALQATEDFLWMSDSALERSDDSNGDIGGVFMDAIDQWLDIAAELRRKQPDAENWLEKALNFFNQNDYGCFDNILRNSRNVLTEEELRQLAWRFENDARKAVKISKNTDNYNSEAAHACIGLGSVAEALGDSELFEEATLITSPTPNTLQIECIVNFVLTLGDFKRAEYWLAQPQWKNDKPRYRLLRNKRLEVMGETKALKTFLRDDFLADPSEYTLEPYWHLATKTEQKQIRKKVTQLSETAKNLPDTIAMLMLVENLKQAEALMLARISELDDLYYGTLLFWLERFETAEHTLACVVCYRCLIRDVLNRGYTKAYRHGARYFHQLLKLDKKITTYKTLDNAQSFIQSLQEQHWRKRSFWAEANYPNKANS